jgi:hypothetical protein
VEILKQLHETVYTERPEFWPNNWILHHDNASAHKALSIKQFLAKKLITEMKHPICSSYLPLNDMWLFQEIKSVLKLSGYCRYPKKMWWQHWKNFHKCFNQWQHH